MTCEARNRLGEVWWLARIVGHTEDDPRTAPGEKPWKYPVFRSEPSAAPALRRLE
jgi:hypothetical protein